MSDRDDTRQLVFNVYVCLLHEEVDVFQKIASRHQIHNSSLTIARYPIYLRLWSYSELWSRCDIVEF